MRTTNQADHRRSRSSRPSPWARSSAACLRDGDAASGARRPRRGRTAFAADRALAGIASAAVAPTRASWSEPSGPSPTTSARSSCSGYAYQQRWRETADASNLPRSEAALRRALRLDPKDPLAVTGLGSLALIRHEFRSALALGRRAQRLAPSSARTYGVVGDALLELGRYEEAFRAFERMVALKPSVASYARIAYARELLGDLAARRQAMQLAADAAVGQREPAAWANVELAKLDLRAGRVGRGRTAPPRRAARCCRDTCTRPSSSRGSRRRAGTSAARSATRGVAADAVPLPQFVALLADLYERAGNGRAARQQVATVARDRPAARRERRPHRRRVGRLRRRPPHRARRRSWHAHARRARHGPRSSATTRSRGRSRAPAAAARRGLVGALAPARHPRRAPLLPPRRDRALRRQPGGRPRVGAPRARARSRRSPSAGRRSPGGSPPERPPNRPRRTAANNVATAPTREEPHDGQERRARARAGARCRAAIAALFAGRAAPDGANAASHREAPLISLDPAADISDFFMFRSYEPGKADRVVLIMNVNPGEEPSSGPNYYGFDPSVDLLDRDRQRPGRQGGRRPLRLPLQDRDPRPDQGSRAAAPLHRRRPAPRRRRRRRSRATASGRRTRSR